ncbi:MAG: hypothetical protein Q7S52_00140 [bacterium]|nr:hypothetical protein [bacterium]
MAKHGYERSKAEEISESSRLDVSLQSRETGSELQKLLSAVTSMLEEIKPLVTETYHPTIAAIEEREKLERSSEILLTLIKNDFEATTDESALKEELDQLKCEIVLLDQERVEQYKHALNVAPLLMPGNFVVVPPGWDSERAKQ